MKITQDTPPFKPITIQLHTREEADALWGLCEAVFRDFTPNSPERNLAIRISDWFTTTAKL